MKSQGADLLQSRLKERNLSYADAAKELSDASQRLGQPLKVSRASVWQWATCKNIPSRQPAVVIAYWTENSIPVNAWDSPSSNGKANGRTH